MNLKPEVIDSMKREENICKLALEHLRKECEIFERKYRMSTAIFLKRFDQGKLGDDADYFKWYSLAEGTRDWIKTLTALRKILK